MLKLPPLFPQGGGGGGGGGVGGGGGWAGGGWKTNVAASASQLTF